MELMGDGLIAFLAAVGVSTILWLLAETLLRRHRPAGSAPDHGAAHDGGDPHSAGGLRAG